MIISVPTEIFIFCFYRLYHIEPKIGPTARWIVIHTPNTAAARPQALGLMPTLNQPNVLESEPGARATNLARLITSPATISIPAKARIERSSPTTSERASAPTPCGIRVGALNHSSHASQRPRYESSLKLDSSLHSLKSSGSIR